MIRLRAPSGTESRRDWLDWSRDMGDGHWTRKIKCFKTQTVETFPVEDVYHVLSKNMMPKWKELEASNEVWNLQLILKKWRSDSDNKFVNGRHQREETKRGRKSWVNIMIALSKLSHCIVELWNELSIWKFIDLLHLDTKKRKKGIIKRKK